MKDELEEDVNANLLLQTVKQLADKCETLDEFKKAYAKIVDDNDEIMDIEDELEEEFISEEALDKIINYLKTVEHWTDTQIVNMLQHISK